MKHLSFDRYNSKVKRVNLPIPSFEYVHKSWFSSRLGSATPGFMIGRDRIIEKLKAWLAKEKTDGGSYLITGYRGMGKTSFVDRVLYELVGEPSLCIDSFGRLFLVLLAFGIFELSKDFTGFLWIVLFVSSLLGIIITCKYFPLKEKYKKYKFRVKTGWQYFKRKKRIYNLFSLLPIMFHAWKKLTPKEWDRINNLIYGSNLKDKRYSNICVNVNLGQEILDERSILCVLTSELYNKYRIYVMSPVANAIFWIFFTVSACILWISIIGLNAKCDTVSIVNVLKGIFLTGGLWAFIFFHHLKILCQLKKLSRRIDAAYSLEIAGGIGNNGVSVNGKGTYNYPIANTRDIESQLIFILERIERFPVHPKFYFVFDELDKIETSLKAQEAMPEFISERYHPGGGTSRKRQAMVLHLLANMKFFTTTAKAKFIFIAGREMYDGYLADMTDRESAISSLFNGVIYVESFCKNEKSEKDVMYNAETFVARQLIPKSFIEEKVVAQYLKCKLTDTDYQNIDIDLKMYYEYLVLTYADKYLKQDCIDAEDRRKAFDEARARIDKVIGLLYHFTVYLYHISNGSPKKMRLSFEGLVRPLRNKREFVLNEDDWKERHEGNDLDIHISSKCKYLLSFGEKEQKVIGFIHYITFPVNQIITDANQFGDKLLVSASFLINHIYKYHSGGFSWRNIEQTPELLEVYKIPEFRGFIRSILTYLLQTHIIHIPFGLFQFKFRKQISEEISLASKMSEEVSTLFNFTREESQVVKEHYRKIQQAHNKELAIEQLASQHSVAGLHHIMGDLFMADEDYNNAIIAYQTALSVIDKKKHNNTKLLASYYLPYTRNMLKLGLAYEKRRTLAAAYSAYSILTGKFIEYVENAKTEVSSIKKPFSPEKYRKIEKISLMEDTKLVYQSLLAKLFINEKMETGGITRVNFDTVLKEFETLQANINTEDKFMLSADFYRRLGDIMFYKNGMIGFEIDKNKTDAYLDTTCKARVKNMWKHNRTLPCYACMYYRQSLKTLLNKLFNNVDPVDKEAIKTSGGALDMIKMFCTGYNSEKYKKNIPGNMEINPINILQLVVAGGSTKTMRQNYMLQLGEILDSLGNTMLACGDMICDIQDDNSIYNEEISVEFLCLFLHDVRMMNEKIDKKKEYCEFKLLSDGYKTKSKLEIAILYFWEASVTFRYGREQKKTTGSLKKILRVIQNYLRVAEAKSKMQHDGGSSIHLDESVKRKVTIGEFLNEIKNRIIKQCLINLYSHYNFINLVEIQRLKWVFYTHMYENISLNRLTLFPDVEEIMLIYYEMIRLCVIPDDKRDDADKLMESVRKVLKDKRGKCDLGFSWDSIKDRNKDFNLRLTGIYNNIALGGIRHDNTSYERILSLKFKAEMNRYILNMAFPNKEIKEENIIKRSESYIKSFIEELGADEKKIDTSFSWKSFFPHIYGRDELYVTTLQDRLVLLEFLIKDSIYCLTYILESITPYTSTTLFTHSFMGSVYQDLNQWNVLFDSLFKYYKVLDESGSPLDINDSSDIARNEMFKSYDKFCKACSCPCYDNKSDSTPIKYIEQKKSKLGYLETDKEETVIQHMWQSRCPYYGVVNCENKKNEYEKVKDKMRDGISDKDSLYKKYKDIFGICNVSDRFFNSVLSTINKPNIQFLLTNYSGEMSLKSYRKAKEVHREGQAYKDMISRMYFLDDDLKNDTVQFDLAIERFKINSGYIDQNIDSMLNFVTNSIYDIESFGIDNESNLPLTDRFLDVFINASEKSEL